MKEQIIDFFRKNGNHQAYQIIEINDVLNLKTVEEYMLLEECLVELAKEGILYYSNKKNKYCLFEDSHLLKGKLTMNKKGYGFVELNDGRQDIYISESNIGNALDGDIVVVELLPKKSEGRILRTISRDSNTFVGEVYYKDGKCYVKKDHGRDRKDIRIKESFTKGAVDGHKVVVKLESNFTTNSTEGEILTIIGHKNDVGVDILSFVYEHNFRPDFPKKVIQKVDELPTIVRDIDLQGRIDLRKWIIFTIDGDDTKDIDDAISIKKLDNGNYELGVHIADVSYYVKENDDIDLEAYERGTSVYLVDRVLPMLPHKLSNGVCSLNPNVDRLTLSCVMEINHQGEVVSYDIFESVIKSRIQMTYNNVNNLLDKGIVADGYEDYCEHLKVMLELSKVLRKMKKDRGYIEFESGEAKIIVDEECVPLEIKLRVQGTGENMIEDFMIVANETVAEHNFYRELPSIYRVHDRPSEEKLQMFLSFITSRGITVKGSKGYLSSRDLQQIIQSLQGRMDSKILNDMAIRSQAKAIYSESNTGHFGLGSSCYAHFTSPIRRYPDLTLHRLIKDYEKPCSKEIVEKWEKNLPKIAIQCSEKEQDSMNCERDVEKMKKAQYMESHIGEEFEGVISGVHEFGIFIELPNTVEGMIKRENLPKDYYNYIEKSQTLIGEKTGVQYRFGDPIKVRAIAASKENSTVDFEIVKEQIKNEEKSKKKEKNWKN